MKTLIRWLHLRKCEICGRRGGVSGRGLDASLDPDTAAASVASTAPATWLLCDDCYVAVGRELARAGLRNAARVQVALGVVAAERGQAGRYSIWDERHWEQLSDRDQDRLLIWLFGIAFAVHALAFMIVAAYVAIAH